MAEKEPNKKEKRRPHETENLILVYGIQLEHERAMEGEDTWWKWIEIIEKIDENEQKRPHTGEIFNNIVHMVDVGWLKERILKEDGRFAGAEYHTTEEGMKVRQPLSENKGQTVSGRIPVPQRI